MHFPLFFPLAFSFLAGCLEKGRTCSGVFTSVLGAEAVFVSTVPSGYETSALCEVLSSRDVTGAEVSFVASTQWRI